MSIEEELIFSVSIIGERKREANQEKKDGGGDSGQISEQNGSGRPQIEIKVIDDHSNDGEAAEDVDFPIMWTFHCHEIIVDVWK